MKQIDAKNEIEKSIIDLIRKKMFYGHILQQLSRVYFDGENAPIPTMGVGKGKNEYVIKLYVNKKFMEHLFEEGGTDDKAWGFISGCLEHETLHITFDHLNLVFSDTQRGNIAVDLVCNSCIDRNLLIKNAITPELFNFPPHKSSYWYYQNLPDNKKYKEMCKQGAFGAGGMFSEALESHKSWAEASKDPFFKDFVKDVVRQAKELCNKDYGNIPAEVISQVEDYIKNKKALVPWNKVLRTFCASATESNLDYTLKRESKRFGTRPGTRKEDVLNLAVGIDSSGSISDLMLEMFCSEIRWIYKNGAIVTVYECDTMIHNKYKFKGKFDGIKGRGGTDLEPVLKETEGKYDALIYFTDFYAPPIEKRYNIPILWVLRTELDKSQYPYKWGRHIKIDIPEFVES